MPGCRTASTRRRPRSSAAPRGRTRPGWPGPHRVTCWSWCWRHSPASTGADRPRGLRPQIIRSVDRQALGQVGLDLVDADPLLLHRVAFPHGHGLVLEGVEVDGDAVRGADLVLAAVAAADGTGVVEVGVPPLAQ